MKQSDENLVTVSKLGARTFDIERYFQTEDGRTQLETIVEIEKLIKRIKTGTLMPLWRNW